MAYTSLPREYDLDTPPRFTSTARRATARNVYDLAANRGFFLLVQPGSPGLWRLRNRKNSNFLREGSTLAELRAWLKGRKTIKHKLREKLHGVKLAPHPWALH